MRPPFKKTPVAIATNIYLNSLNHGVRFLASYFAARDAAKMALKHAL